MPGPPLSGDGQCGHPEQMDGDPVMASAALDRLLHRSTVINTCLNKIRSSYGAFHVSLSFGAQAGAASGCDTAEACWARLGPPEPCTSPRCRLWCRKIRRV